MRSLLAVFEREVVERRLLVAASLFLGLVPLAAPWLPGLAQRGDPEIRTAMALALALCFSFGLALILGATVLARDLAERRLSFYFSRPLPGWAVWAGKLAAAAGLALCAGALILLPASALERRLDLGGFWTGRDGDVAAAALLWAASVLLLVLLGHAAGVALRSRSPWLITDFAGLGLVAWLAWAAARRLTFWGAFGAVSLAATVFLAAALLALLAAGAAQVLQGRTDIRRGHRLLSLTLWGALLAAGLAAQGYASWVLAAQPADLEGVEVTAVAPRGSWIAISGTARYRAGYFPAFLLDASTGLSLPILASRRSDWTASWFSADGRWALWLEPQGGAISRGSLELLRLDLRDPRQRPERTRITYAQPPSLLAVSADGGRVAVAAGRRLTLEEVPSGRLLASTELPRPIDRYEDFLLFVDPGRVRIFGGDLFSGADAAQESAAFEAGEMRVAGGGLVRTARIEQVDEPRVSRDGARILLRRRSDGRFVVFDAATGAPTAELPAVERRSRAAFLADGRIALVSGGRGKELRVFSPALVPERAFHFKTAKSLRLGGQPAPDRLVVAVAPRGPDAARWDLDRILILDLDSGSVRRLRRSLIPLARREMGPGSIASRLFLDHLGRLIQLDLDSGEERVVAGRKPA